MAQTRSYDYALPANLADAARTMTGLEFFHHMMEQGARPPMAATLNFQLTEVGEGWTKWTGTPGVWAMNPIGSVHGGFAATVLDSALACAIHTTLKVGEVYTTVDLNLKLVRPLKPEHEITAESRIVHRGSRIATSDAQLFDHRGKLAATGTTSCLIMRIAS